MQNIELIPDNELQRISQYIGEVKNLSSAILQLARDASTVNLSNSQSLGKSKGQAQNVDAYERELNKLITERTKLQVQLSGALDQTTQANIRLSAIRAKETNEMRLTAKESLVAANSIEALRANIAQLSRTWASLNINSPKFTETTKQLNDLRMQLTTAEMSVGNFTRASIGGFNPLNFQVQQLARELPSLAHSVPQFFLAISNNLPMLADELEKANKQYSAFKKDLAAGLNPEPVQRPISQIIKSILSWQTLLVVGITYIVANSKAIVEWTKSLFIGEKAALSLTDAIDKVNEKLDYKDVAQYATQIENLRRAWIDLGGDIAKQTKFIADSKEKFDSLGVSVTTIQEAENLLIDNTDNFIRAMQQRSIQLATADIAAEKFANYLNKLQQSEDIIEKSTPNFSDFFNALFVTDINGSIQKNARTFMRIRADEVKAEGEAQKKEWEQFIELGRRAAKEYEALWNEGGFKRTKEEEKTNIQRQQLDRINLSALRREREAREDINKAINEGLQIIERENIASNKSLDDRIKSTQRLYELQRKSIEELAQIQSENIIERNMDENPGRSRIEAETAISDQLLAIQLVRNNKILQLEMDLQKNLRELNNERIDDAIRNVEREVQAQQRVLSEEESNELAALSELYSNVLDNQEKYEDKRLEITRKYALLREQGELDSLERQLAERKYDTYIDESEKQQILDLEQEIADYRVEINKNANDRIIEDNERLLQQRQKLVDDIINYLGNSLDIASELMSLRTDRELVEIERRSEASEKETEDEIARIDRLYEHGAISEEQANARKAKAEQEQQIIEEQLNAQRAEVQKRQARMQVIVQTAQAIMQAVASAPWPLNLVPIGFATAMGAVQLAAVDAARYAQGTPEGGHKGGLAWIGDGGRSEMVLIDGKAYKSPSSPTLINLPKGAEVLPDYNQAIKAIAMAYSPLGKASNNIGSAYSDRNVIKRLDNHIALSAQLIRETRNANRNSRFIEFKNKQITN